MGEYLPVLILGALIGVFSLLFILAWWLLKRANPKSYDRHMADGEIIRRLLVYAKPYRKEFILALIIMLFSIGYDLLSPLLVGHIEKTVAGTSACPTCFPSWQCMPVSWLFLWYAPISRQCSCRKPDRRS